MRKSMLMGVVMLLGVQALSWGFGIGPIPADSPFSTGPGGIFVQPYSGIAAVNYALSWWRTDRMAPAGTVDTFNSPTYRWYFTNGSLAAPNNTTSEMIARDCANFASQCLIAGGLSLNPAGGHAGQGGTYPSADSLLKALQRNSNAQSTKIFSQAGIPANLTTGDIVIFCTNNDIGKHATVVVGRGTYVTLAAHSNDTATSLLTNGYFPAVKCPAAYAIHISSGGSLFSLGDSTPPSVVVRDPGGQVIPNGGVTAATSFTVNVTDTGEGISQFELLQDDSWHDAGFTFGTLIYEDPTNYLSAHQYAVSGLAYNHTFYVQVYDGAGNLSVTSFSVVLAAASPKP